MKTFSLPAETAIVPLEKRADMILKGMAYANEMAKQNTITVTKMMQTLEFSTQVADTMPVGTHQRQREFQNVETLAGATDRIARTLLEAAKVMAGLASEAPAQVLLMQNNYYSGRKPKKRKGAITIDNSAPAYDAFED